jgi:hypothetical protein
MQFWIPLEPWPIAPDPFHDFQLIPVTMLPASALKSISDGFTPDHPFVIRIGSAAGVEVVVCVEMIVAVAAEVLDDVAAVAVVA